MSTLGLLALTGIVVNTAVIYVDRVLARMEELGESRNEAITGALAERMRPILLTAGTTVIGMIPLTSSASPLWPPLAWTVIGGILSSTLLTLFVMPAALRLSIPRQDEP
jgi:multidrug efflux pump subunit AcrB